MKSKEELLQENKVLKEELAKLQETKDQYCALFDKSPIGFVILNKLGIIQNANPTFTELTDYSRSELIAKPFADFLQKADKHLFNSQFKAFYKNPQNKIMNLKVIKKNNQIVYVKVTGSFMNLPENKKPNLILAISNVTRLINAEKVIEKFFDLPMNIHLITDMKGTIEKANLGFLNILGYHPKELVGNKFFDLIHPDDVELTQNEMKKLAEGQTTFEFKNRYKHKNGNLINLKWAALASPEEGKVYAVASDITKVKRYQNELMASKNQFQNLAETTDAILWEFNINQDKWTYVSPQSKRILGYEPQEWLGLQFWTDHLHPEDRKWASKYCFECTARGESHKFEYRFMNKAGKPIWIRDVVSVEMKDGKPVIMRGFMIDITSSKEMEKQINESNERFKFLSSVTFEGIVIHNNGIVLDSNQSFLKLTGYNSEEVIGKNLLDYVPSKKDKEKIIKEIANNITEPYTVEAIEKNGKKFIAEIEAKNVIYQGQKVRIAAIRDVTEKIEAQKALQESEERFKLALKGADLGLWDWNLQTGEIFFDKRWAEMLGYSQAELEPNLKTWQALVHPEDLSSTSEILDEHLQGKTEFYEAEFRMKAKSGKWKWILDKGKVLEKDAEGKPLRAVGTHLDITERKQIETRLQIILNTSQQKEAEVQELLNAAHAILEKNDFQEVARHIFDACGRAIGAKAGYVALMSDDGQENELLFLEAGGMQCDVNPDLPMPIRGLRAESYKSGKVVYDNDFMQSEWLKFMPQGHMTLPNVLFAPLNIEGKTVGIMGFACKEGDFDEHDARLAAAFGDYAAIALNNSRIFDALEKSEKAYSQLFHNVGEGIGIVDENEVFTFCNEAAEEIFEVPKGELKGKKLADFISAENMKQIMQETEKRKQGESTKYELEITSGKGNRKYLWITANPHYDEAGNVESTFGIFFDVTKRKLAEEKVQHLLQEKELLLREVHHRIKNNMATIESLLRLHSKQIENEAAKAALNDANGRVKSMRILYDKLFRSDNFKAVDMKDYLSPLIDEVIGVFPQKEEVKVIKEIASFSINAKLVFPLGIIINELITNIMKYAFQTTTDKKIIIKASKTDNHAELIIQDNGAGLPADFDLEKTSGFGLQLVNMLADQINAEIKFASDKGTEFTLVFNLNS